MAVSVDEGRLTRPAASSLRRIRADGRLVRNASAVALTSVLRGQRRKHCDVVVSPVANAANLNKRPSRLVRIVNRSGFFAGGLTPIG